MRHQITKTVGVIALCTFVFGAALAAETDAYKGTTSEQRQAALEKARASKAAALREKNSDDIEYRALVEPKKESKAPLQPGDVAVHWNGPQMKISLGL